MSDDSTRSMLAAAAEIYMNICLNRNDLDELLNIAQYKIYHSGDTLCEAGQVLKNIGFVLDGTARSYFLTPSGKDITRYFHTKFCMVMDEAILNVNTSHYICSALDTVSLLLFDANDLKKLIASNDHFKNIYIRSLENGMRYKLYREQEFMTKNATQRYEKFLKDYPDLPGCVKQSYIATYLGIEPESLSRIKKSLKG